MLVAHHIIDCLSGSDRYPFMELPGVTMATRRAAAHLLASAEKFDFGDLLLEPHPEGRPGHWTIPTFTDVEIEFFLDGYIVLPAPVVWYEWTLGSSRSGLLIRQIDSVAWGVQRIDWTPLNHAVNADPVIKSCALFEGIETQINRQRSDDKVLKITVEGNVDLWEKWSNSPGTGIKQVVHNNIATAPMLALYLTLMLNSKSTEIVDAPAPPPALNKKRMKAGRAPLAAHRIVTIVPERFRKAADEEAKGTHRPPRLHWRRSHLRHFDRHTPTSRWMPHVVHDGRTGWWVAVIPRMLVGRADLGEVSHEYRMSPGRLSTALQEA